MTSFFADRRARVAILFAVASAGPLGAQTIAQRLAKGDRPVQVIYPSRQTACGDGRSYIGHVFKAGRAEHACTGRRASSPPCSAAR
jgi:hypothetical protein